ncbi:oligosaccharide flippase family protein [Sphingomonas sp. CD22]|uniref:lipopolysaccharide biosynthesis protein n=1 Tax=Sphingomonas sp. CD22 TaxID=3100214 RepID=UPI002ADF6E0E|nr:oligosaccharide flippase family protein [Sphingomonas sp. CD22]MEA1085869.1 oligosaccharide flippase family protein [Sphingomonas sp. CD22]
MFALDQVRGGEREVIGIRLGQNRLRGLHWNVASGLVSSGWSAIASLLVLPFYLRVLGAENFGLISFFTSLQGALLLLDLGFSTTMNREVARSQSTDSTYAPRLLRTLELLYWLTAILIGVCFLAIAPLVARSWFSSNQLSAGTITSSLRLMAVLMTLRWPVGLYLGAITGAGRASWVNFLTIIVTSLSTVGAVLVLMFIEPSLRCFLLWQIIVSLLQVVAARYLSWHALGHRERVASDFTLVPPLFGFSSQIAAATLLGVIVAQLDKLILPRFVSLDEVGKFGVAFLVSRLLITLISPVYSAFYPHLTALIAGDGSNEVATAYRLYSRIANAILFSTAAYIAVFGVDIITVWTGDQALALHLHVVLPLLVAGSALNASMYFPHALQLARGDSNAAVLVNLVMFATLVPTLAILLPGYGIEGAAIAWFLSNVANVAASILLTHRRGFQVSARLWLVTDFLLPMLTALLPALIGFQLLAVLPSIVARLGWGLLMPTLSSLAIVFTVPALRHRARAVLLRRQS